MTNLTQRERLVLNNIEEISEKVGSTRYFVFSELVDFDLNNSEEELKKIVKKLQEEGFLNDCQVWVA